MGMIKQSDFRPARWLANPHLQTLWPTLSKRDSNLPLRRERVELSDGDFIDLDWVEQGEGPLVLVLHGLAGSIRSPYAKNILQAINAMGWRAVFMYFRGRSGEPNRLPRSYHSGDTSDLQEIVDKLRSREPNLDLAIIGYSMGGNILLKWMGENRQHTPLFAAVAISVPFDIGLAAERVNQGFSRVYQWWLLRRMCQDVARKFAAHGQAPIDLAMLRQIKCFKEYDQYITVPMHGFQNLQEYYEQASSRHYLKDITVPTLILHAEDDPFMTPEIIPDEHELSPAITLEISQTGGHVGFVAGNKPWQTECWLSRRIPDYLSQFNQ